MEGLPGRKSYLITADSSSMQLMWALEFGFGLVSPDGCAGSHSRAFASMGEHGCNCTLV